MSKAINSHISSSFHGIINSFLERNNIKIIKQDIDSGIIDIEKKRFFGFFEIKRSFGIERRKPYLEDKNNYCALYELSQKLGIKTIVVFYEKNKIVEKGIKFFEMKGGFDFLEIGIYPLRDLKNKLLEIYEISFNDATLREEGLQGREENIYYYMKRLSNYGYTFYSEDNGRWMIVSDTKTYQPIFVYKEMINEIDGLTFSDSCFINLANDLKIPYFRFCYKSNENVVFYKDNNKKNINIDEFLENYKFYSNINN